MQLPPLHHLRSARVRIANALPSLDACIAAGDEPVQPYGDPLEIVLDQQADFLIGEFEKAAASLRSAKARVAEKALRAKPTRKRGPGKIAA